MTNLLCTIINTGPEHITMPRNRNIGKLTPLNENYTTVHTASINEIMHVVKLNVINADWTPHDYKNCAPEKNHKDQPPLVASLI